MPCPLFKTYLTLPDTNLKENEMSQEEEERERIGPREDWEREIHVLVAGAMLAVDKHSKLARSHSLPQTTRII